MFDPNSVFVVTASTTTEQVPRNVRIARVDGTVRFLPHGIFRDCKILKEVVFEEGAHTIGKRAFLNCSALTKVQLPSTLQKILEGAFNCCKGLRSIELPLGLQVIGKYGFSYSNLRQLDAPATVETIEKCAFAGCPHLESVVLPPRLDMIAHGLFMCCDQLREIQIPATVESIGGSAFSTCRNLIHLDLSHCIHCVAIGCEAFLSCEQLSFIHLPPNLESIEKTLFINCPMLTHVRVPPNVTSIEIGLFSLCPSLVSLEVPEGLESIHLDPNQWYADNIADCSSLVNLYWPPSQDAEGFENKPLPEDFQLAKVATDLKDLRAKLRHRFDDLPLHQVCYFHSYHPVEDTIEKISDILKPNPSTVNMVDAFGMTSLHILALAQRPEVEIFQRLPNFENMALSSKDYFGSTPLDYLCKNPLVEGMRATRRLIRKVVEHKVSFLGLDQWKQDLLAVEDGLDLALDVTIRSNEVKSLVEKLVELEFLELLSLVEMKLWKIQLKNDLSTSDDYGEKFSTDRESCRVHCGISIVVGNVLPFLGRQATTSLA